MGSKMLVSINPAMLPRATVYSPPIHLLLIPPKACFGPKLSSAAAAAAARHICARLQVGEDAGKLRMALAAFLGRSMHGWADVVGQEAVQELAAAAEAAEGADQVLHLGSPWSFCLTAWKLLLLLLLLLSQVMFVKVNSRQCVVMTLLPESCLHP